MNSMLNIHNPRQCYITRSWSRYLSLLPAWVMGRAASASAISRKMLWRCWPARREEARTLMRQLLQVQKQDGSAMHQFNPLTMVGERWAIRAGTEDRPHYYSDDHLWIVLAVYGIYQRNRRSGFPG